ncbi:hypothetical protein [Streptomyces sp. NPDC056660]
MIDMINTYDHEDAELLVPAAILARAGIHSYPHPRPQPAAPSK